ncbi:hypothetical protein Tco_1040392, partial [Tanacetum coccineum]
QWLNALQQMEYDINDILNDSATNVMHGEITAAIPNQNHSPKVSEGHAKELKEDLHIEMIKRWMRPPRSYPVGLHWNTRAWETVSGYAKGGAPLYHHCCSGVRVALPVQQERSCGWIDQQRTWPLCAQGLRQDIPLDRKPMAFTRECTEVFAIVYI